MAVKKLIIQSDVRRGVHLAVQVPMHNRPKQSAVLGAVERWLPNVKAQLLDLSADRSMVSRRRQRYQPGITPSHDRVTGCTFSLVIEGDTTPLTLAEWIDLALSIRECIIKAYSA